MIPENNPTSKLQQAFGQAYNQAAELVDAHNRVDEHVERPKALLDLPTVDEIKQTLTTGSRVAVLKTLADIEKAAIEVHTKRHGSLVKGYATAKTRVWFLFQTELREKGFNGVYYRDETGKSLSLCTNPNYSNNRPSINFTDEDTSSDKYDLWITNLDDKYGYVTNFNLGE